MFGKKIIKEVKTFNTVEFNAEMDAFVSDAKRTAATKRNMESNRALTRNFRWTK